MLLTLQGTILQLHFINHTAAAAAAAAAAKLHQLRPTLCDPIDGSPPGSSIPRILQARTLEWVAIAFSMRQYSVVEKSSTYKGLIQLDSSHGLP